LSFSFSVLTSEFEFAISLDEDLEVAWPSAQGPIDHTGWQGTQARQWRLGFERGHRAKPALLGQCSRRPKDFYDIRHWNDAVGRYNLESEYQTTD
jgi:hypothetical protein